MPYMAPHSSFALVGPYWNAEVAAPGAALGNCADLRDAIRVGGNPGAVHATAA